MLEDEEKKRAKEQDMQTAAPNFADVLYPQDLNPPEELVHQNRFLVGFNRRFAIYINKEDHGPPHIHVERRLSPESVKLNRSLKDGTCDIRSPHLHYQRQIQPKQTRFLLVEDIMNGNTAEAFPYTSPSSRATSLAADRYPENTSDGSNAKRKYSMGPKERAEARRFACEHVDECIKAWNKHVASKSDDPNVKIPLSRQRVERFLTPNFWPTPEAKTSNGRG